MAGVATRGTLLEFLGSMARSQTIEPVTQEAPMIFEVADPDFERRVRTSFARQGFNETMGATLGRVTAGVVEIQLPFSAGVSQQHGYFHGGVMGAIGDSACGYAAMTLTPAGAEVLTREFKVNFLSPGRGERLSREDV